MNNNTTYNTPMILCGPFRKPKQMLVNQEYGGHKSLHDNSVAFDLGFRDAPIEGPTHFSQFIPLLVQIWGNEWYEKGCFSAHFVNMVIEGEAVKAFVEVPQTGANRTKCWAEKEDGSIVLEASASIATNTDSLLNIRMSKYRPISKPIILKELRVGMKGIEEERIILLPDTYLGKLYPFTLNQKLKQMTEKCALYWNSEASPWSNAIVPFEMISVLGMYSVQKTGWEIKHPVVGLFADLEIKMLNGPLLVGQEYLIKREIVALGGTRRTEGYWTRSQFFNIHNNQLIAEMLLHQAFFKHSYPDYPECLLNSV